MSDGGIDAIAVALAHRFDPGTMTPPAGENDVRSSSANAPNELGALPLVLVFADTGGWATGSGDRQGVHRMPVRFYLTETLELERESARLRVWADVLGDRLRQAVHLGGACDRAAFESYRLGILRYAGRDYAGLELVAEVSTSAGWDASG